MNRQLLQERLRLHRDQVKLLESIDARSGCFNCEWHAGAGPNDHRCKQHPEWGPVPIHFVNQKNTCPDWLYDEIPL